MSKALLFFVAVVVSIAWTIAQTPDARAQGAAKPVVKVKPPASAAKNAKPPATAKQGSSIGKGNLAVKTANGSSDTDSIWVQQIDIDGDGDVEEVDSLWDDEDKVLYLYDELDVACALTSGIASSSLLIGVYGEGNSARKPAGSGWWAALLDETECAVEETDAYGCRFDASGNAVECAEVDTFVGDDLDFED
jgi:hypothetical protein